MNLTGYCRVSLGHPVTPSLIFQAAYETMTLKLRHAESSIPFHALLGIFQLQTDISTPQPNNGMHPTADTLPLIKLYRAGRRVMPGVRTEWMQRHESKQ